MPGMSGSWWRCRPLYTSCAWDRHHPQPGCPRKPPNHKSFRPLWHSDQLSDITLASKSLTDYNDATSNPENPFYRQCTGTERSAIEVAADVDLSEVAVDQGLCPYSDWYGWFGYLFVLLPILANCMLLLCSHEENQMPHTMKPLMIREGIELSGGVPKI